MCSYAEMCSYTVIKASDNSDALFRMYSDSIAFVELGDELNSLEFSVRRLT
jgi:hypothetical protein